MSEPMKEHRTSKIVPYIELVVGIPGKKKHHYKIPYNQITQEQLQNLIESSETHENLISPWNEAIPWEKVALPRIARYTERGLVLRGARYREGLSQKELARRTGISQDNISKMENGKRSIGEKTAKTLAAALNVDYKMFLI